MKSVFNQMFAIPYQPVVLIKLQPINLQLIG